MTSVVKALEDLIADIKSKPNDTRYATHIKKAQEALSLYSQSKEGEEIDRLRAALEKIKTEYKIITIHRIAKEVLNNKQRVY